MSVRASRIVEAPCGSVQGRTFTFENGREASAFQGIPFAKPPVGELRFKVGCFRDSLSKSRNFGKFI